MPAGARRGSRNLRPPNLPTSLQNELRLFNTFGPQTSTAPTGVFLEPPKHFPFPNTPYDSDLFYEIVMYLYALFTTGLQFLHLYRTVWWLPHSYTSQAMNFYLIDKYLVTFITLILYRRLIYLLGCKLIEKTARDASDGEIQDYSYFRVLLFILMTIMLSICACFVIQNQPKVNILYLGYPILVYLIMFGINLKPLFDTIDWPLHACSSNASDIRKEARSLRENFNSRMRQILFNSILTAYYAGFIPCCFAQPQLHYDKYWATQHFLFVFLSSFIYSQTHIFSVRYCDILHRSALHLGIWEKVDEKRNSTGLIHDWRDDRLWPLGALVRHENCVWKAVGDCNSSKPGDRSLTRFYKAFIMPYYPLSILLGIHLVIVFYQLFLLIQCSVWYKIVSLAFMLFFNYYTLYKLCRDYLVSYKIYKRERLVHLKIIDYR